MFLGGKTGQKGGQKMRRNIPHSCNYNSYAEDTDQKLNRSMGSEVNTVT